MRANIAYSVNIDEIPREVCGLLPKSLSQEDLMHQIIGDLEEENIDNAITNIDHMRKEMFEIDQRLADCSAILQGYLKNKYSPPANMTDAQSALDGLEKQLGELGLEVQDDSAS